jgi:hypothetical protein
MVFEPEELSVLEVLSKLDDRLCGSIRFVRAAWLLNLPPTFRMKRRQELEDLERSGMSPTPLLSPEEAVALIRACNRSVGSLTYGWLTPGDPDPDGRRLAVVRAKLPPKLIALATDQPTVAVELVGVELGARKATVIASIRNATFTGAGDAEKVPAIYQSYVVQIAEALQHTLGFAQVSLEPSTDTEITPMPPVTLPDQPSVACTPPSAATALTLLDLHPSAVLDAASVEPLLAKDSKQLKELVLDEAADSRKLVDALMARSDSIRAAVVSRAMLQEVMTPSAAWAATPIFNAKGAYVLEAEISSIA